MKKVTFITLVFLIFSSTLGYAQLSDLARVDYTILPAGTSDVEYSRVRGLFNYPVKLKKEGAYLLLGLDYSNIKLDMNDNLSFDTEKISDFQILDLNIAYTTPLKNDWRLGVRLTPGFSSNLTANDLSLEDVIISGDVVFIKDKKKDPNADKPWSLILGVSYSGNRGFPFPLPFISYYRKFHEKWSYNLGIPKTNLQYHISEKHRLKLYTELDGFTANLQQGVLIDNSTVAESINMSLLLGGLQYEFHVTSHLQFYARSSYVISSSVNFRDNSRNNIKGLDNTNDLYLRTGLRFKI
ncbi:DUF6268 family outer membrane beta-barrel protein [Nonlabens ulvanivorans]|uniref:DUF6268 family outer membrane beta-barrel protein n=1 Tax=Nonlabens ulvanivorans TaxID=906888 RepID=UPI002943008F|nr:DUF6268 family outer membrane beta-barrel protein [Nonlabens ulvanivorans]WOI23308.1 DUF6268 family outer membrane beta-barrel protein [Nonlabens ulvanivorans]